MTQDSNPRVVVFGATGAVGRSLIEQIAKNEPTWKIEAVSRSGPQATSPFSSLSGVTVVKGDAEYSEQTIRLCRGASIVYCTIGFPHYKTKYWRKHWPVVVDNLLAATSSSRLVFCDNLYAYGPGKDISPSSPLVPHHSLDSKPAIRSFLRRKLQARMDKSPRSIVVVGGADFFGPNVTNMGILGDTFFGNLANGNKPLAIGSDVVNHDFCYVPDFARALYLASTQKDAYGEFWICPHSVHNKTMREIAQDAAIKIDPSVAQKGSKVTVIPTLAVRALGMVDRFVSDGFMHEMKEMLPWWTNDYTVDDSGFLRSFDVSATPYEQALSETIAFFQERKE